MKNIIIIAAIVVGLFSWLAYDFHQDRIKARSATPSGNDLLKYERDNYSSLNYVERPVNQNVQQSTTKKDAEITVNQAASCTMAIEKKLKYRFEWTHGMFKPQFIVVQEKDGKLTAAGGYLKAENEHGAWSEKGYECQFKVGMDDPFVVYVYDRK